MKRRIVLVLVAICLMLGPVLAARQLTEKQTMQQAIALLEPLDAYFTGTARTQFRQALTRLKNLYAAMPDDQPTPTPVDCVFTWTQTGSTVGACVNGQQTRTTTYTLAVTTPAQNGGAACPSSTSKVETTTEPCTVPPPPSGVVLTDLSLSQTTVAAGSAVTLTATLSGPAPGARDVLLSASPSGVLSMPASLRVREASTSGSVTVTVGNPSAQTTVTITGVLGSVTTTASLTVTPGSTNPPPPPPPTGGAGDTPYWLGNLSHPNLSASYSLRDSAQLERPLDGGYAHSNSRPLVVTYDPANDPDSRRQDAAKIVIGTGSNSLTNQVRLPIPRTCPESLFVTWEVWFGAEWDFRISGIPDYKTFQFGSPYHDIHMEVRNRFELSPGTAGLIDGRLYPEGGYSQGPNVTFADTLKPQVGTFRIKPETWTRYFALFKAPAAGSIWYEYSLWVADPATGPVLLFDRLQVRPSPQSTVACWESFWLEFNTSTNAVKAGRPTLVAYARNVQIFKGLDDPRSLLIKP